MSAHDVIRKMMEQAGDQKQMPTAWVFKNLVEITVDLAYLNAAAGQMEQALREIATPEVILTLEKAREVAEEALTTPDLSVHERTLDAPEEVCPECGELRPDAPFSAEPPMYKCDNCQHEFGENEAGA